MPKDIPFNTNGTTKTAVYYGFISEGFISFTPEQAAWIVRDRRYDRQRDETKAKGRIAVFAEQMSRGIWTQRTQIDFAILNGELIMVNGHTRMRAQEKADAEIVWSVVLHPCETMDDVRKLYYTFDTNVGIRSAENILNGVAFDEMTGLKKQFGLALWKAAPIVASRLEMGKRKMTDEELFAQRLTDDRLSIAMQYLEEALILQTAFANAPIREKRKLRSGGLFALGIVTTRAMPEKSKDFWTGIADNDGLRRNDPRATFLNYISNHDMSSGVANAAVYAGARCWNAFVDGRDQKIIKVPAGGRVKVAGTNIEVRV